MIDLKNLNVILTGATGGIGGAILEKLYNYNAKIIATGTNEQKLKIIKANITEKTNTTNVLDCNSTRGVHVTWSLSSLNDSFM